MPDLHFSSRRFAALNLIVLVACVDVASATDHFITIAGGYKPEGNQASLEANVLFFRQVLSEEHRGDRSTATFFADGWDDKKDLQVAVPRKKRVDEPDSPATNLLATLYESRGRGQQVYYRNHKVEGVAGPIEPESIRNSLMRTATNLKSDDRVFIYVTAHGGSAKGRNSHNTTISCWDEQSITAKEFEGWLDEIPGDVPVVMVMAQCYCGGFAHVIFDEADSSKSISSGARIGFFAQQHDLAAAGCRPDIENDEEYSSFFWGAIAGRTRNGKPIESADLNQDGRVSFDEAHAHAILASKTIDIPLRASDAFLRKFSEIDEISGSLKSVVDGARETDRLIAIGLAEQLGLSLEDDVSKVYKGANQRQPSRRRSFGRRSRGGGFSSRRKLLDEIGEKYPSLADRESWRESTLLVASNQTELFDEIKELPSFEKYEKTRRLVEKFSALRESESEDRENAEFLSVKFRRLKETIETIALAKNLARFAEPEQVEKFRSMLALEDSFLDATGGSNLRPF